MRRPPGSTTPGRGGVPQDCSFEASLEARDELNFKGFGKLLTGALGSMWGLFHFKWRDR